MSSFKRFSITFVEETEKITKTLIKSVTCYGAGLVSVMLVYYLVTLQIWESFLISVILWVLLKSNKEI